MYKNGVTEINKIFEKADQATFEKIVAQQKDGSVEEANEWIKMSMKMGLPASKYEDIALKSLDNDQKRADKLKQVENLYKRLLKSGCTAEKFKEKAKSYFIYSTAFQ